MKFLGMLIVALSFLGLTACSTVSEGMGLNDSASSASSEVKVEAEEPKVAVVHVPSGCKIPERGRGDGTQPLTQSWIDKMRQPADQKIAQHVLDNGAKAQANARVWVSTCMRAKI